VIRRAGQQLDGFGQLQDDGSTSSGLLDPLRVYTEAGNNAARRGTEDPPAWHVPELAFSWPANRRVLYNAHLPTPRASLGPPSVRDRLNGKLWWAMCPTSRPTPLRASTAVHPAARRRRTTVCAVAERRAVRRALRRRPRRQSRIRCTPRNVSPVTVRVHSNKDVTAPGSVPVVCTTYRLTEMYHYWTHHTNELNQLQPGFCSGNPCCQGTGACRSMVSGLGRRWSPCTCGSEHRAPR